MARTKNNERAAASAVDVGATGTRPASKGAVLVLVVCVFAAIWALAMMTPPGRVGYLYFFMYAEYYMGVITLVSLSITIMVGLVATDRLVLSIRQRVLLQSTHRTTGLIAVTSLLVHVWSKVVESHIRLIDAFIPFISPTNTVYVGLGTISGWIMFLVMWTGIARSKFIGRGQPWMWRSIHAISYLMWPIALVHGLSAGRPAKAWVTVSYILCILLVLVGLAVRLSVSLNRRKDFSSTAGAGGLKPVGKMVPTASPAVKKRQARWAEPEPVAVVDGWKPAAPPQMAPPVNETDTATVSRRAIQDRLDRADTAPVSRRAFEDRADAGPVPRRAIEDRADTAVVSRRAVQERLDRDTVLEGELQERPRARRRAGDEGVFDEPAPRGRRYADDEPPPRRAMDETPRRAMDETPRRAMDDTQTRMRRVEMDDSRGHRDEPPAPRQRRYAEEETPRARYGEAEAPRARYAEDEAPRARYAEDYDEDRYQEDRYQEDRFPDERYAEDEAPRRRRTEDEMPRARRVEEEMPRGRRAGHYADDEVPRQRSPRYAADDEPPARRGSRRESRYAGEAEEAPRARRDRGADDERAGNGRHSVAFTEPGDEGYLPPDDTPTLIDMASRRARRAAEQDTVRGQTGRGARRTGRARSNDDAGDDRYWSDLRGEAK